MGGNPHLYHVQVLYAPYPVSIPKSLVKPNGGDIMLRTIIFMLQLVLIEILLLSVTSAHAQSAEDEWQFSLSPLFLWGMNVDGTAQIGPAEAPVGVTFDDVLENMHAVFTFHFEAKKRDWTFFSEYQYVDLQPSFDTPVGPIADLDLTVQMGELGAAYRVTTFSTTDVELLAGARYSRQDIKIRLEPGPGILDTNESWWDGFIGVRLISHINDKWTVISRGDIGAGGSDFVWNLAALVDYRFRNWGSVFFGYRWLDYDYDSGNGKDRYAYDALQQGPLGGVTLHW